MGCMRELGEDGDNITVCPYCGYDCQTGHEAYCLVPGTILHGRYVAGRTLEYKGHVVKYIGYDAENRRKVIINEYLPQKLSSRLEGSNGITIYSGSAAKQFEDGLLDFLNKGNLISGLSNTAGLGRVYDCIAENDTGYIISEYMEGNTLQQLLDEGSKYTINDAKRIIKMVLQCLNVVHSYRIIHGGISPETIFIESDGNVKLIDFGIAGHSKLKPGYAAEEQYRNNGKCGAWTDVYSAGAVMYRLVTGIRPPEARERILRDSIKAPSSVVKGMPKPLENALLNSVNIYQKDRTPSAEAFLGEIASQNTARRKTGAKRKENNGISLWVKIAVPVFACVVAIGGGMLYKANKKDAGLKIIGKADEKFGTCIDKTYSEFKKRWEEYGFSQDKLEVEFRYDNTVGTEDKVKEFIDLTKSKCMVNGESLKNITDNKDVRKNGVIAKVIVASKNRYTFLPDWYYGMQKVKNGEKVTYDQKKFYGDIILDDDDSQPYGTIKKINIDGKETDIKDKDGVESFSELPLYIKDSGENKKNNVSVTIYTGSYYTMKRNMAHKEDFYKTKNINEVLFTSVDRKNNTRYSKCLDESKYESNYISFKEDIGKIMEVFPESLKNGRKYDGRKETGIVFATIGKRFNYKGITVNGLSAYCNIQNQQNYGDDYLVTWIDKETFKENDTVTIKAEPKPTPTPEPTPRPTVKPTQEQTKTPVQQPLRTYAPAKTAAPVQTRRPSPPQSNSGKSDGNALGGGPSQQNKNSDGNALGGN